MLILRVEPLYTYGQTCWPMFTDVDIEKRITALNMAQDGYQYSWFRLQDHTSGRIVYRITKVSN